MAVRGMCLWLLCLCVAACGQASDGTTAAEPSQKASASSAPPTVGRTQVPDDHQEAQSGVSELTKPVTIVLEKTPSAAEYRILSKSLAPLLAEVKQTVGGEPLGVAIAMADLNADGRDDMVVHVQDYRYCGQMGCSAHVILAPLPGSAPKAIDLGIGFNRSIKILPKINNGMHNQEFDESGVEFGWTGQQYDTL